MRIVKLFGPPGTGKTSRLLDMLEEKLAQGVPASRIAFLAFTVEARRVAKTRAVTRFGLTDDDLVNFKTLHALCYRELNLTSSAIIRGPQDLRELAERLNVQFTFRQRHADDDMLDMPLGGEVGDRLLQFDHVRRHRLQSVEQACQGWFDDDLTQADLRRFVREYGRWKDRNAVFDFTDLLEQPLQPLDVDVVFVDEAQDLSLLQWRALQQLSRNAAELVLAGDDDQGIFTWAGADPQGFIDHPGEPHVLGVSHRLPRAVYAQARALCDRITRRFPKDWVHNGQEGQVAWAVEPSLIKLTEEQDTLVLYRQHYLASDLEAEIRLQGLPYTRNDKPAPGAEWGAAILAWERLRKGETLPGKDLRPIFDGLATGVGITDQLKQATSRRGSFNWRREYSLEQLRPLGLTTDGPWFDAFQAIRPDDRAYLRGIIRRFGAAAIKGKPRVRLSTIHAAKGAEAAHVVLLTAASRRVLEAIEKNPDDERRVFYVGVSRAKERLTIVGGENPLFYGRR